MNDFEKFCITTDVKAGSLDLQFYLDGMNGEHGEISEVIKRARRGDYGQETRKDFESMPLLPALKKNQNVLRDLILEIYDEMWYTTRFIQELGLQWSSVFYIGMQKSMKRVKTGTVLGKGDHREQ